MKIFVYGSLKKGYEGNKHLKGAKFCGTGYIKAKLCKIYEYPGIIKDNKSKVYGEIYEINKALFEELKFYEGSGYYAKKIECYVQNDKIFAYTFFPKKRYIEKAERENEFKILNYEIY